MGTTEEELARQRAAQANGTAVQPAVKVADPFGIIQQPATTQPATTQPATTQPATTQPATTQPATTQPATTQPATTQPAAKAVEPVAAVNSSMLPTSRDQKDWMEKVFGVEGATTSSILARLGNREQEFREANKANWANMTSKQRREAYVNFATSGNDFANPYVETDEDSGGPRDLKGQKEHPLQGTSDVGKNNYLRSLRGELLSLRQQLRDSKGTNGHDVDYRQKLRDDIATAAAEIREITHIDPRSKRENQQYQANRLGNSTSITGPNGESFIVRQGGFGAPREYFISNPDGTRRRMQGYVDKDGNKVSPLQEWRKAAADSLEGKAAARQRQLEHTEKFLREHGMKDVNLSVASKVAAHNKRVYDWLDHAADQLAETEVNGYNDGQAAATYLPPEKAAEATDRLAKDYKKSMRQEGGVSSFIKEHEAITGKPLRYNPAGRESDEDFGPYYLTPGQTQEGAERILNRQARERAHRPWMSRFIQKTFG